MPKCELKVQTTEHGLMWKRRLFALLNVGAIYDPFRQLVVLAVHAVARPLPLPSMKGESGSLLGLPG